MKRNKKIKTIFVIFFIIILFLVFFVYKSKQTPSPSPTPVSKKLSLVSINPPAGEIETIYDTTGILITFTEAVNPSTIKAEVSPDMGIITSISRDNPAAIVIRPEDKWLYDVTYTITLSKDLKSVNNNSLDEDIIYSIKFIKATNVISL